MQALILVGGLGTRLRPLTTNYPKSLIPFAGRPMVEWQIEALVKVGVTKIVLAICYKEEVLRGFIEEMKAKYNIEIVCSLEKELLNTGGAIKLAEPLLLNGRSMEDIKAKGQKSREDAFFVLNSDIICDYPFEKLMAFHLKHAGEATILSHDVEDPSRFGVILHDPDSGEVASFVEKPQVFVGRSINAGIYVFDLVALSKIELRNISVEREVFPMLAAEHKLFVTGLEGFWHDIGLPHDFLACNKIMLNHFVKTQRTHIDDYELITGPAKADGSGFCGINLVHREAKVEKEALVGPFCVLHKGVLVEQGARVSASILMDGVVVGKSAHVFDSIVMFNSSVGPWTRLDRECIVADKVNVGADMLLTSEKIEPGQNLSNSVE